jgi:hypothetical protein
MAITITAKTVRITKTTKNENKLEARYSGSVGFEVALNKTAPPFVIDIPFRDCQGMPAIMSRSLAGLESFAVNLRAAVRNERTNHGLPSA